MKAENYDVIISRGGTAEMIRALCDLLQSQIDIVTIHSESDVEPALKKTPIHFGDMSKHQNNTITTALN